LTIALLAGAWSILPVDLYAAGQNETQQEPVVPQWLFASPDEAVKALQAATQAKDKAVLKEIFGPEVKELLTGDAVQDANNAKRFATALAKGYTLVKEGEDKITIEVGTNNWPMPIPLVKANGQWYFDTAAGKEEVINRHIGKDELNAIGVCQTYVAAQRQYAAAHLEADGKVKYAQKFKSASGKKDGLYWPSAKNEQASPFGPQPFHGYYFRILTQQGKAVSGGKMNYMVHGNLTKGFALVAYPSNWDHSGVMTFIVNQDNKVFQRNFGEITFRIVRAMKEYNPDSEWTLVQD
jgi:hypothetical protein